MENVLVLFDEPVQREAVHQILSSVGAARLSHDSWEIKTRRQHVVVDVLSVPGLLVEYEPEDLDRLIVLLGSLPEFALSIAYRTGDASSEMARRIADMFLNAHRSVIDHNGHSGIASTTVPFE
ncbi:MAG: hypothetical protein ACTHQM_23595 [Thermoanaerobaculia bacterium]